MQVLYRNQSCRELDNAAAISYLEDSFPQPSTRSSKCLSSGKSLLRIKEGGDNTDQMSNSNTVESTSRRRASLPQNEAVGFDSSLDLNPAELPTAPNEIAS